MFSNEFKTTDYAKIIDKLIYLFDVLTQIEKSWGEKWFVNFWCPKFQDEGAMKKEVSKGLLVFSTKQTWRTHLDASFG